jgi:hypothetical protein
MLVPVGTLDADGWKLYRVDDLFQAAFLPTPVVTDELDRNGNKTGDRFYDPEPVTYAKISLTVTVTKLERQIDDADVKSKFYSAFVGGLLSADSEGNKGVKVRDREFAIANSFGVEIVVDRGDYRYHGRAICVGDKFYQVAVGSRTPASGGPAEYADVDKWVKKFFDSFKVLSSPAAVETNDR